MTNSVQNIPDIISRLMTQLSISLSRQLSVIPDLICVLISILCQWPCICLKVETPGALNHTSMLKSKGFEVELVIVPVFVLQLPKFTCSLSRCLLSGPSRCECQTRRVSPWLCLCHVRSRTIRKRRRKLLAQILFSPISNSHTHICWSSHIHIWYFPHWMASSTFVLVPGTFVT